MRERHKFEDLVKTKEVVIPIIQRDYAQGRDNGKALNVRTRLIEDWIDKLSNEGQYMDFNFIYGNETGNVFHPVDGQQRLTSLFLLHWHLAFATGNQERIRTWRFDYKTRNSASEFFDFLRRPEKANSLYDILQNNTKTRKAATVAEIKEQSWFKVKWENDPTISSCINFLVLLSTMLKEKNCCLEDFWKRLTQEEPAAIYFTYLTEENENAEVIAAKRYTRMNDRGKKLTDFENLKAMLDEIESKHLEELKYCKDDKGEVDFTKTVSHAYDCVYLNAFYQDKKQGAGNTLEDITKRINRYSFEWYEFVYNVYCKLNGMPELERTTEKKSPYSDKMYRISQGRETDEKITDYLWMLKAVQEILCNSEAGRVVFDFFDLKKTEREKTAFVLFAANMWKSGYKQEENKKVWEQWGDFKALLDELEYGSWSEYSSIPIMDELAKGVASQELQSVRGYLLQHTFTEADLVISKSRRPDIKCRILEQKVKAKLLQDGVLKDKAPLRNIQSGHGRWGYLFVVMGYLEKDTDWDLGDWSSKAQWSCVDFERICKLYEKYDIVGKALEGGFAYCNNPAELQQNTALMKLYAFASQYDSVNDVLKSQTEINQCNNEHIWKQAYLQWNDTEFGMLRPEKRTQLMHLKTFTRFLLQAGENVTISDWVKQKLSDYFKNHSGYADCWLRVISKIESHSCLKELLLEMLENKAGTVMVCKKEKRYPFILWAYLKDKGYDWSTKEDISVPFAPIFAYERCGLYREKTKVLKFEPGVKYQHTSKWYYLYSERTRHVDLIYKVTWDWRQIGMSLEKKYFTLRLQKDKSLLITVYEITGNQGNELVLSKCTATVGASEYISCEQRCETWEKNFQTILENKNYDEWLELLCDGGFIIQNMGSIKEGGMRPKQNWSEGYLVPALQWNSEPELY